MTDIYQVNTWSTKTDRTFRTYQEALAYIRFNNDSDEWWISVIVKEENRIVQCVGCDGSGEEIITYGSGYTGYRTCPYCDGTGTIDYTPRI